MTVFYYDNPPACIKVCYLPAGRLSEEIVAYRERSCNIVECRTKFLNLCETAKLNIINVVFIRYNEIEMV